MGRVLDKIKHWEDGARVVGVCACGGDLMFVEDEGARRPLVAQCTRCTDLTGVPRAEPQPQLADGVRAGSPEDFGF